MNDIMKRRDVQIVAAIVIIIILGFVFKSNKSSDEVPALEDTVNSETTSVNDRVVLDSNGTLDIQNETFIIDGQSVVLIDGAAETRVGSGIFKTVLLEGPAFADINGDGLKDAVVLLRNDTGSGIFYYVSTVLTKGASQSSTNSVLLGDRIRIKEISIDRGVISVSILERVAGEAITAAPSISVTHTYNVVNGVLSRIK